MPYPTTVIGTGARVSGPHRLYHEFRASPLTAKRAGGAATGTAGDRNIALLGGNGFGHSLQLNWTVIGTQTILAPVLGTNGLDIGMDQTSGDGQEWDLGQTARSPFAFTVGTDRAFFLELKAQIEDVSGANPFMIGFRKAEAFQTDFNDYDEMASIGIVGTAAKFQLQTILNNAATVVTDTTQTATDATAFTIKVKVSKLGVVTYEINDAAPTVVAAYTFDSGEVVVPFGRFVHAADVAGTVELVHLDLGYQ